MDFEDGFHNESIKHVQVDNKALNLGSFLVTSERQKEEGVVCGIFLEIYGFRDGFHVYTIKPSER